MRGRVERLAADAELQPQPAIVHARMHFQRGLGCDRVLDRVARDLLHHQPRIVRSRRAGAMPRHQVVDRVGHAQDVFRRMRHADVHRSLPLRADSMRLRRKVVEVAGAADRQDGGVVRGRRLADETLHVGEQARAGLGRAQAGGGGQQQALGAVRLLGQVERPGVMRIAGQRDKVGVRALRGGEQSVQGVEPTEERIDIARVGHVVPVVGHR